MKKHFLTNKAFTLVELLVVISIIALLASIAFPVLLSARRTAAMSESVTNGQSIYAGLKLFAGDNNGIYPSYTLQNGQQTNTQVADSNTAFAQLIPQYIDNEKIFWNSLSHFCSPNPPNNVFDNPPLDNPVLTMKAGDNCWAYVLGLNDSCNSTFPIIATGFTDPNSHTYTKNQGDYGGVWKGQVAIVIRADGSGKKEKVNPTTMKVPGGLAGSGNSGQTGPDLFANSDPSNWLGSNNIVVNPKKPGNGTNNGTDNSGTDNGLNGSTKLGGANLGGTPTPKPTPAK